MSVDCFRSSVVVPESVEVQQRRRRDQDLQANALREIREQAQKLARRRQERLASQQQRQRQESLDREDALAELEEDESREEMSKGRGRKRRRLEAGECSGDEDGDPSDDEEGIPARIPFDILKITTPMAVYEGVSVRTHLMLLSLFCIASGKDSLNSLAT